MKENLAKFFTGRFGLLVLGFVLTTVCGAIINGMYSCSSWQRDKKFELLKSELVEHDKLLSDLTKIIGARTFRLQRIVWLMDPPEGVSPPENWSLDEKALNELKARWEAYYQTVIDWNVSYRTFAIKIRVLAGDRIAEKFIVPDLVSGARKAKAGTLCGTVEETHNIVANLKSKALATAQVARSEHDNAQRSMDHLYDAGDDFVRQLYEALRDKEQSDNPFKPIYYAR